MDQPAPDQAALVRHPLDPLTAEEFRQVARVLRRDRNRITALRITPLVRKLVAKAG